MKKFIIAFVLLIVAVLIQYGLSFILPEEAVLSIGFLLGVCILPLTLYIDEEII